MRRTYLLVLLLAFSIGSISSGQAENLIKRGPGKKHRPYFGLKAGIINQTFFRVVGKSPEFVTEDMRTRVGFTGELFFDIPTNEWMMVSVAVDMNDIHVDATRTQMLDLSLSFKFPFYKEFSNVAWRPTFGVGYGYLGEVDLLEKSSYTTLRAGVELVFYSQQRYAYLGEVLVYSSPWGENDEHKISFGPVVLIRLGVIY